MVLKILLVNTPSYPYLYNNAGIVRKRNRPSSDMHIRYLISLSLDCVPGLVTVKYKTLTLTVVFNRHSVKVANHP
jgi:hypothetical protein